VLNANKHTAIKSRMKIDFHTC